MKLGKFGDNKNGSVGWNWHKCKIRVNLKPGKNKLKMIANSLPPGEGLITKRLGAQIWVRGA